MNIKYITVIGIFAVSTLLLTASDMESYTLPTGKTLNNPHIVSRTPIGIEVAHDTGVIFVKFSELPKDMQKKLGYSPDKELKYKKNISARRHQTAKVNRGKAKVAAAEQRKRDLVILERAHERLGDKIAATKLRIQFLVVEIPKYEAKKASTMSSSTGLASRSSNSGGGGYSSYYGNRYSSGNRSGRSERTKRDTINALDDEYAEAKRDLKMSQQSLKNKQFELRKMERQYKKYTVEIAEKRAAITGKKSSKSKSLISSVTSLFE
ncbi:MAG: hypothetical protein L3J71_12420 [Victivallaceae bacterium]|nr:hypothetical protein [Victivallaceae bacterium]